MTGRGTCPVCGRVYALNGSGRVRAHDEPGSRGAEICAGGGLPPVDLKARP